MIEDKNKLNIKDISFDNYPKTVRVFDSLKDLNQDDLKGIYDATSIYKNSGAWGQYSILAIQLKFLSPELYKQLDIGDDLWFKLRSRGVDSIQAGVENLAVAKMLFPKNFSMYSFDESTHLSYKRKLESLRNKKKWDEYINFATDLQILFPGKHKKTLQKSGWKEGQELIEDKYNKGDINGFIFLSSWLRTVYPDMFNEINLSGDRWRMMLSFVEQERYRISLEVEDRKRNFGSEEARRFKAEMMKFFGETAKHLAILAAQKIKVDENGLTLVDRRHKEIIVFDQQSREIPNIRNF
jgi:hypothetical protein